MVNFLVVGESENRACWENSRSVGLFAPALPWSADLLRLYEQPCSQAAQGGAEAGSGHPGPKAPVAECDSLAGAQGPQESGRGQEAGPRDAESWRAERLFEGP